MEIVEEHRQVNPSRLLAQIVARAIQYLSNRKEIDQFFVRIVLENKDNLHKIVYRKYHGLPADKSHREPSTNSSEKANGKTRRGV